MKFETNNLVIFDNPNLKNLIIPVGFFSKNDTDDDDNQMKLFNKIMNNKYIDDDLYDKLFHLADNTNYKNKTKKKTVLKSKTIKHKKKKKKKKTIKRIKLSYTP